MSTNGVLNKVEHPKYDQSYRTLSLKKMSIKIFEENFIKEMHEYHC